MLEELGLVKHYTLQKHADIDHYFAPIGNRRKNHLIYAARKMINPIPEKPFMFCFVRHPLSWYESWYKYMEQPKNQWRDWGSDNGAHNWHPNSLLNGLDPSDFPDMMRKINFRRPGYVTELFGWYTKSEIDFVGKQENLVDDLVTVLKTLNENFDEDFVRNYGKVGVSPTAEQGVEWPDDLRKETEAFEHAGIVRYGYELKG